MNVNAVKQRMVAKIIKRLASYIYISSIFVVNLSCKLIIGFVGSSQIQLLMYEEVAWRWTRMYKNLSIFDLLDPKVFLILN
jgi:hypothetical protein